MPLTKHVKEHIDHMLEQLHQGRIDFDDFREDLLRWGFPHQDIEDILDHEGFER